MTCITIQKIRGYRLSPCLPPPGRGKYSVLWPLTMQHALVLINASRVNVMISSGIPNAFIAANVNSWLTESKAFSKSNNATNASLFALSLSLIVAE